MATVIDALVVTLGLDPAKFTAGSNQVQTGLKKTEDQAEHTAKELESRGKQAAEFFNLVKGAAIGLATVLVGGLGLEHLGRGILSADAALGRTSDSLGINSRELSAWANMAEQVGGSAADASAAISAMTLGAQQFRTTGQSSPLIDLLLGQGISPTGSVTEQLIKLSAAMQGLSKADATNRLTNAGLPPALITLIERGPDALRRMLDESNRLGVVSPEQAKAAEELQENVAKLETQFISLGRSIVNEVAPVVIGFLKTANEWLEDPRNRASFIDPIISGIRAFIGWLQGVNWTGKGGFWDQANAVADKFLTVLRAIAAWSPPSWLRTLLGIPEVDPKAPNLFDRNIPGSTQPSPSAPAAPDSRKWYERFYKPGPGLLDGLFGSKAPEQATPGAFKPILDLLGKSEGTDKGRGYDETMGGGRYTNGPVNLTNMTLEQVGQVQKQMLANGASSTAVGRYQFIQDTLKTLASQLHLDPSTTKFTPAVQDRLAEQDIVNRGGNKFLSGAMSFRDFMLGLAKEWASIANPDTGRSYYGQRTGASVDETTRALRMLLPSNNDRMAMNDNRSRVEHRSTHETNIGAVNVYTNARDGKQIASDIVPSLRRGMAAQANTGLV